MKRKIAPITFEKYVQRYNTLVKRWESQLSVEKYDSLLTNISLDFGVTDVVARQPTPMELVLFLVEEFEQKKFAQADDAILKRLGQEVVGQRYRKYSSFESDRSALLHLYREGISEDQRKETAEFKSAIHCLKSLGLALNRIKKHKSIRKIEKSTRPKKISETDWLLLADRLSRTYRRLVLGGRQTLALKAAVFMSSTLACGARPSEWVNAEWTDEEHTGLRFTTSKQKESPSPIFEGKPRQAISERPIQRSIEIDASYRSHIEKHFEYIEEMLAEHNFDYSDDAFLEYSDAEIRNKKMAAYAKACGAAILAARKKVWRDDPSKAYTLYVARAQYAAILSLLDPIGKYEKMGWSSKNSSAASHYGTRKDARGPRGDVMHVQNALMCNPIAEYLVENNKQHTAEVGAFVDSSQTSVDHDDWTEPEGDDQDQPTFLRPRA